MKRVIELIRVSTEGQAAEDRASIPAQRAINRRTEQAYGLTIVRSIELADVSGAAVLYAPEIQELLKLIAAPDIHGVVTKEFSRLMRPENFSDYAILQAFIDTKTILYLPDGPIDFTTKGGLMMGTLRAVMAGMEMSDIRDRLWAAKEERRKQGKLAQSRKCLPFAVDYSETSGWSYTSEIGKVREAFRLALSGDASYWMIAQQVGLEPRHVRLILRNPIYTGWRIITERRDPSPSARRTRRDGRQGDRRKIKRAPEDVIRVRVIEEGAISEEDFERVQQIIAAKRARCWQSRENYSPRFTYNGYLTCGVCGQIIYTKNWRADYYVCKGRYYEHACAAAHMRKDRLESEIDRSIVERLADEDFLRSLYKPFERRSKRARRSSRTADEIARLEAKRRRILDAFFDGAIDTGERNHLIAGTERDLQIARRILAQERPLSGVTLDRLSQVLEPFAEWGYLPRDERRRLLSTLAAEIRVANYTVYGLNLTLPPISYNVSHMGTDSSPPPA